MHKRISYSVLTLFAGALLPLPAFSATTFTETVIGAEVGVPAATSSFSTPFHHPNLAAGESTSLTDTLFDNESTLGQTGAGWGVGAFAENAFFPTHYIEVLEPGPLEGYVFDVIDNTASSLLIAADLALDYGLGQNFQYALRKHLTILDLFLKSNAPDGTIVAFLDNNVPTTYIWNDGTQLFGNNGSTRPVYPGEGFLIIAGAPFTFSIDGVVKHGPTVISLAPGVVNLVSSYSPVSGPTTDLGSLEVGSALNDGDFALTFSESGGALTPNTFIWNQGAGLFGNNGDSEVVDDFKAFGIVTLGSDPAWTIPSPQ